ncbi:MAG: hypothetical protein IJJ40_01520 [Clostridia bacterium]|nr:hypothetical protein [Clostridia bacterium]
MKKRFAVMFSVLLCVVLLSLVFAPAKVAKPIVTVGAAEENTLAPRFLNMLNHNYAYNEGFETFEGLTESAVLGNLSLCENGYIPERYIKSYLADMYGIAAVTFDDNSGELHKDGFVYVKPMGYTTYKHENPTVTENEDGTYTVLTDVTVGAHDSLPKDTTAVTLFAPNKNSAFGFVIIYSNISTNNERY